MVESHSRTRCGTIAILGLANVGKSTLMNSILGRKLAITSVRPQTTRQQILGIKTREHTQWIYIDTPGVSLRHRRGLNQEMVWEATAALEKADLLGFVIEAGRWTAGDEALLERLQQQAKPVILVLNKVDKIKDKLHLLPFLERCSKKMAFAALIPLSARSGENVSEFERVVSTCLPFRGFLYPIEQDTDRSSSYLASEFIREKLMRSLYQELPYQLTVLIEKFEEELNLIRIHALIVVEREGQKAIIIGKNGELLKKIATSARLDMQDRFGKKVYLKIWVKLKRVGSKP